MIKLGKIADGRLAIASSQPFPADIQRVEYYKEQRYFMLVYEGKEGQSDLMPCDISPEVAEIVEKSPDIMVVAMFENGQSPYGYDVPLVQVGI